MKWLMKWSALLTPMIVISSCGNKPGETSMPANRSQPSQTVSCKEDSTAKSFLAQLDSKEEHDLVMHCQNQNRSHAGCFDSIEKAASAHESHLTPRVVLEIYQRYAMAMAHCRAQ